MNDPGKDDARTLELLGAIEQRSDITQRDLAQRLGVALGLANSYLKRCAQKGLIKIQQVPPNRYFYYLTPRGFAEKSRLVGRYLTHSFSFYREASEACGGALRTCRGRGFRQVALCGVSELAEIAVVRGMELDIDIAGVLDPNAEVERFAGRPVWRSVDAAGRCDGFILTELAQPAVRYQMLVAAFGKHRVVVPDIIARFASG